MFGLQGEGTGDGDSPRPSLASSPHGSTNVGLQMSATTSAPNSGSDAHRRKDTTEMSALLNGKVHKSDSTSFSLGG